MARPGAYAVHDDTAVSRRRLNAPTSSAGTVTGSVYASGKATPQAARRTQAASTNRATAAYPTARRSSRTAVPAAITPHSARTVASMAGSATASPVASSPARAPVTSIDTVVGPSSTCAASRAATTATTSTSSAVCWGRRPREAPVAQARAAAYPSDAGAVTGPRPGRVAAAANRTASTPRTVSVAASEASARKARLREVRRASTGAVTEGCARRADQSRPITVIPCTDSPAA